MVQQYTQTDMTQNESISMKSTLHYHHFY